jgi:hypothetical protein
MEGSSALGKAMKFQQKNPAHPAGAITGGTQLFILRVLCYVMRSVLKMKSPPGKSKAWPAKTPIIVVANS